MTDGIIVIFGKIAPFFRSVVKHVVDFNIPNCETPLPQEVSFSPR